MWHARTRKCLAAIIVVAAVAGAEETGSLAQGGADPNAAPNPYRVDEGWAKLAQGRKWGAAVGVDIDRDGKSVWVFDRCATADDCSASNLAPIQKFDGTGRLVTSFGAGMFNYPHGLFVDRDDNVWVSDGRAKNGKGHTVMKFSPDGKLLMTLGKPGVAGDGPDTFNGPSDILIAPGGDIFIADGHGGDTNARIVKLSKDGKFIKAWGKKGSGPGEFDTPHGLAMDSAGRLFVADRSNSRIQLFNQDGRFLAEWRQFGRPSGVFIDKKDVIYVADSTSTDQVNPGYKQGIRIGSVKDGKVTAFIPWTETNTLEGVAADDRGNVYGGFTNTLNFRRFVKNVTSGQSPAPSNVPRFQVDPAWPKIPNNWQFGQVASVSIDAQDHVWVLQRPGTLSPEEKPRAAPPLLEFDPAGNFIQAWGGPGQGYEWPSSEHGVYVDPKGYVWIGGNGAKDNHVLKFTKAGKFVMQIGRAGQSKGNADTQNLNQPADTFVYPKTNELFVADGYGNRRVIVFDADSGKFKRMWGAFGNVPTDGPPNPALPDADPNGAPQFVQPVHAARVSNDGLVYVSDRGGKRVQVFTLEGKYVAQVFIGRDCKAPECGNGTTAASTAFSTDPEQRFLYVGNRSQAKVMVLNRRTLEILDSFGQWGSAPGDFGTLHHMAADSKGNLYVTEVTPLKPENRRIQKFILRP